MLLQSAQSRIRTLVNQSSGAPGVPGAPLPLGGGPRRPRPYAPGAVPAPGGVPQAPATIMQPPMLQ